MFPFKFELKEAVMDYYLTKTQEKLNNDTIGNAQNHLFAFYLMFLDSKNRSAILDYVRTINKTHYNIEVPHEFDEYMENLPKVLYTALDFKNPEHILLELGGIKLQQSYFTNEFLNHVVEYIKKHHSQHSVNYF